MSCIMFEEIEDDSDYIEIAESLQFNFDTIRVATSNFSDDNELGRGGFGVVYQVNNTTDLDAHNVLHQQSIYYYTNEIYLQGRLPNGQVIAVKRLSRDSGQGDIEFKNEAQLVAKLQHRNLVRLLGFCLEGRERLLVYEFVPNKSLDYFIFGRLLYMLY